MLCHLLYPSFATMILNTLCNHSLPSCFDKLNTTCICPQPTPLLIAPPPQLNLPTIDKINQITSNLCWSHQSLSPGVSHFLCSLTNHPPIEILKVSNSSNAHIKIQDARSLCTDEEHVKFQSRLPLENIFKRIPNAIAAINGGFYHFKPPPPQFYNWKEQTPYQEGEHVGDLIVNGSVHAQNPQKKLWGSFQIDSLGRYSIQEDSTTSNENTPKYALGGVPILIRNGQIVDLNHEGVPPIKLIYPEASPPGDYQTHIFDPNSRTAVCITKDNDLLFAVLKRTKKRLGIEGQKFAEYLQSTGCKSALNLDGGGSSNILMFNEQGNPYSVLETYNKNDRNRPIASAIVITR